MAWPKGKPRPDAFKKKGLVGQTYDFYVDLDRLDKWRAEQSKKDKFTCECGNRMIETDYLNQLPGYAEYTCLKCGVKKIVNFHK